MRLFDIEPGTVATIQRASTAPEQVHVFAQDEIDAVNAALAARRSLLVRGEPGTGKTQLAHAIAVTLKRPFVSYVVDSRTEPHDLLWHFDAVRRLAEAQVYGALLGGGRAPPGDGPPVAAETTDAAILEILDQKLDIRNFIQPRALWWGLNWAAAAEQAGLSKTPVPSQGHANDPANGAVVLIDEIDKGDSDVPNGLLEALGAMEFVVPGRTEPIRTATGSPPPLTIITTNEERILPDAFVRRCVVLQLQLPPSRPLFVDHLVRRGRAHFAKNRVADAVLTSAAQLLFEDRKTSWERKQRPLPGQAEYMDLVRAIIDLAGATPVAQEECLQRISQFVLRKHAREPEAPSEA